MTARLIWSARAHADLLDIYVVVGLESPSAAERLYDAIEARAKALAAHPRLGPRRPDIRQTVRVLVEGPYLILYRTEPDADDAEIDEVTIIRVVDGRRDLAALL